MTSASLLARSALLGAASGARASLGLAAPALVSGSTPRHPAAGSAGLPVRIGAFLAIAGELTGDKLPQTPARTVPPQLGARFVSAATGASTLARREGAGLVLPVLAGLGGAAAGLFGGLAWRRYSGGQRADWHGAVLEDGVALALALVATR